MTPSLGSTIKVRMPPGPPAEDGEMEGAQAETVAVLTERCTLNHGRLLLLMSRGAGSAWNQYRTLIEHPIKSFTFMHPLISMELFLCSISVENTKVAG